MQVPYTPDQNVKAKPVYAKVTIARSIPGVIIRLKEAFNTWNGLLDAATSEEAAHGVGLSNKNVNTPTTQIANRTKATYKDK